VIQITRALAHQIRAVLRKAGASKNQRSLVEVTAGQGELRVRAQLPDVLIEYKQQGPIAEESVLVPFDALSDFEGKSDAAVTFASSADGVEARWDDGKIPKSKNYAVDANASRPTIPKVDWQSKAEVSDFLQALARANECTADATTRFSTHKIQLRGKAGEVIATDGRQLLVQGGFTFPWQEDLLIPGLPLYGCRELPLDLPATVCIGKTHVAVRLGDWTVYLAIDREGRFPDAAKVIPESAAQATKLRLSPQDAAFVADLLSKLPGCRQENAPVTIDLNGQVALRAREEGQVQLTEVVLAGSEFVGPAVRWRTDRRILIRAINLGFLEISINAADKPVVCKDNKNTYVWVPLDQSLAIPPSDQTIRIVSQEPTVPEPIKERMNPSMPITNPTGRSQANGENHANGNGVKNANTNGFTENVIATPANSGLGSLIGEAQALRDYLHDGFKRACRLYVAIKRQKKQSKLMATTLASLRSLQQIEG
jgi:hypothetical protein